jgi:hypothetical protein
MIKRIGVRCTLINAFNVALICSFIEKQSTCDIRHAVHASGAYIKYIAK